MKGDFIITNSRSSEGTNIVIQNMQWQAMLNQDHNYTIEQKHVKNINDNTAIKIGGIAFFIIIVFFFIAICIKYLY